MTLLQTVLATVHSEFSDLADAEQITRVTVRLVVALVLGAAIGWERERHDADAGLRTHMLVSLGAALFVIAPGQTGMGSDGVSRVIQGIVSGIGFLGAGAVLKVGNRGRIHGLTTAATVWGTTAVGIAAGLGREVTAVLSTVFVLVVLAALRGLKHRIRRRAVSKKGPAPGHGDDRASD